MKTKLFSILFALVFVMTACGSKGPLDLFNTPTATPTSPCPAGPATPTCPFKAPEAPASTATSTPTIVAPTSTTVSPTLAATATAVPTTVPTATVAPVLPTATPDSSHLNGLNGVTMPFPEIKDNMDIGDALKTSLTYSKDAFNACFVGIIMPGKNLDFESAFITGKFIQTDAPLEDVVNAGNELSMITGCTNKLFVGDTDAPSGWSKTFVNGWVMSTWDYLEKPIDAGKWIPVSVSLSDSPTWTAPADSPKYCQLWNGTDAMHLYHFFLDAGKTITTIVLDAKGTEVSRLNLQGTCWTMDMSKDLTIVQARATQMSEVEVANRDKNAQGVKPTIYMMYVGANKPISGNWTTTLLTGWTAK